MGGKITMQALIVILIFIFFGCSTTGDKGKGDMAGASVGIDHAAEEAVKYQEEAERAAKEKEAAKIKPETRVIAEAKAPKAGWVEDAAKAVEAAEKKEKAEQKEAYEAFEQIHEADEAAAAAGTDEKRGKGKKSAVVMIVMFLLALIVILIILWFLRKKKNEPEAGAGAAKRAAVVPPMPPMPPAPPMPPPPAAIPEPEPVSPQVSDEGGQDKDKVKDDKDGDAGKEADKEYVKAEPDVPPVPPMPPMPPAPPPTAATPPAPPLEPVKEPEQPPVQAAAPVDVPVHKKAGKGKANISPLQLRAGTVGNSITVRYSDHENELEYRTLIIKVPEGFAPPSTLPSEQGYFTASVSEGAVTSTSVSGRDMKIELYNIKSGEVVVVFGERTEGGPGITAPQEKGSSEFTVITDTGVGDEMLAVETSPIIEIT